MRSARFVILDWPLLHHRELLFERSTRCDACLINRPKKAGIMFISASAKQIRLY